MGTHPIFESDFDCLTAMPKQYGLIIKNKKEPKLLQKSKLSFFDDDEDDELAKTTIEREIKESNAKKKVRKQTQLDIQRALEQDATCFEYDNIYDDMKDQKEQVIQSKKDKEAKKPKYMAQLLKTAEKRNQLNERRVERKVQKERDAEDGEFDDKEKFVTNAYKQKMAEMRKQEEEERLQDMKEEIMDVTKQKDMSGFYKHFLNRQTRTGNLRVRKEESSDEEEEEPAQDHEDDDERLSTLVAEPKGEPVEPVQTEVKTEVKAENPDADSDFLSDDSGDESTKVKNEGAENVKTDPDIEMQQKSETLEEFKARLKQKKERRLDIYRTRHTADTLAPFRERYLERREQKREAGKRV